MSIAVKRPISPLQARMIEDMTARKLHPMTQTAHIRSCRRFAAWLGRSPDTATADDVRRFQVELAGCNIGNSTRNTIMTGAKFLFRVTLRRHDLPPGPRCAEAGGSLRRARRGGIVAGRARDHGHRPRGVDGMVDTVEASEVPRAAFRGASRTS